MKRALGVLVVFLLGVLVAGPLPAAGIGGDPGPGCAVDWTAAGQDTALLAGSPIAGVGADPQECFDRFVIEMQGDPPGVFVQYVEPDPLFPLLGDAELAVLVSNPGEDATSPAPDLIEVDVPGFQTFREIVFDSAFEPEMALGLIGVRERLPFRVFTVAGPGAGSSVVVEVAHAWTGSSAPRGASPLGNFESAAGVEGGVQVKGWMLDPDTSDPIYAWVTIDGGGRHRLANADRPDVGAAFPGYGSNHGFLGTVPASPGAHRVCVTASNVGPGNHTPLGCRNVNVPRVSPFGNFERASVVAGGVEVNGWMADPSSPMQSLYAWVTVDGVGRHLFANGNRPDVGAAFPGYGSNHGFLGTVAVSPGAHRVCVTASNIGPGTHTSLGCRNVSVPDASPFGNFESARGVVGGIAVKGWAIDPDTTAPIYMWVTVDGVGQHLYANGNRPDVGAAYPASGSNHGFSGTLAAPPGAHRVCVTASNVGPGAHRSLGCRDVTLRAVDVYFMHEARFADGIEPYTEAVQRTVSAEAPAAGALQALFAGPTAAEQSASLRAVLSEATGFTDLTISNGIARVRLTGGCNSQGSTFTIQQLITPTLRQFATVNYVKVYSPDGQTGSPDGPSDSLPECLNP